jgi:hypothetical protein
MAKTQLVWLQVMDVWGAAGHAFHPDTCMECCLLPCSVSAEVEEQTPLVEEQRQLQAMQNAAKVIQRWWRVKNLVQVITRFMRARGQLGANGGATPHVLAHTHQRELAQVVPSLC